MKRTDEFNNYNVLNSDGTEHFDESFISTAETGRNAPENYSRSISENQKYYETVDTPVQLLPDEAEQDGFFYCVLRRKQNG